MTLLMTIIIVFIIVVVIIIMVMITMQLMKLSLKTNRKAFVTFKEVLKNSFSSKRNRLL